MEVLLVRWLGSGKDVHLMRGAPDPLDLASWLIVEFRETPTSDREEQFLGIFLSGHPSAKATFKPTYKFAFNSGTNEYEGFGVKVNATTGLVKVGANPGPIALNNFTILASVVADGSDPASTPQRAYLRIHLHKYVAKAWLSPARLSVPKNIIGFQFALYAQFDDKTIAELEPDAAERITWASTPAGKVNEGGFLSFDDTDTDGAVADVSVQLTSVFKDKDGLTVGARGAAIPYTLPKIAQLIPNSAGYERRDEVPNFIFLADGLRDTDEAKFDSMIDGFLTALRQQEKFKPFDRLVARMNFWKAFVPSAVRGVGTKYEVYGQAQAHPVPMCTELFNILNDAPASENDLIDHAWGPNQVRHYFGLPVLAHTTMPNGDIRAYWKQISFLSDALIDKVPESLIEEWKQLGDRRIVDESDSFIGMTNGAPTKAKARPREDISEFQMNDARFVRRHLNKFLVSLQYQDESGAMQPLGSVWDMDPPAAGGDPAGKDFDNVIILLCANFGRALNQFGHLCTNAIGDERGYIGLEADPAVNAGFADGRAVRVADLDAGRLLGDMPFSPGKTTLLHELGHSMGLGDEYAESGISKESAYFQFSGTGSIDNDKHYSNVEVKSDVVVSPGSDSIAAVKVKWRWHRIAKSGVLARVSPPAPAAITVAGAQYKIQLKPGQAAAFAENDVVFLRRRKQGESILRDIEYAQISAPRYPFVTRSPELVVRTVDAAAGVVTVEPSDAGALAGHDLVADFPAECVLYKPLPARTVIHQFPPAGALLELTAANILSFMDSTGLPLHEKKDSLGHLDLDSASEQTPDLADINTVLCAKKNKNIVGLYAGGNQYHHGVYHPTGHCIMRDNYHIAEFCSACKYILTDYIDPSLHPETDKLIEEYYPLKANQ